MPMVHGHNVISVRMIEMCDDSLVRPLSIIFRNYLNSLHLPKHLEKSKCNTSS